mgnify:CR=1 FL=1
MFEKLKEKYWWPEMYKDVHNFVSTCESFQMHSVVRHYDELYPTYLPAIHFKWMVDLVMMPMGIGQIQYLVLAREDMTNQVEGRAQGLAGARLRKEEADHAERRV